MSPFVRLQIDAGRRPRAMRVLEHGVQHQKTVGLDDRQSLAAVGVGGDAAKTHVLGVLHVEAVAPHFLGDEMADGDVLGALADAQAVAPFAGLALVLVALAFERAADHPDIGDAGDGEQ